VKKDCWDDIEKFLMGGAVAAMLILLVFLVLTSGCTATTWEHVAAGPEDWVKVQRDGTVLITDCGLFHIRVRSFPDEVHQWRVNIQKVVPPTPTPMPRVAKNYRSESSGASSEESSKTQPTGCQSGSRGLSTN